jgi:hypothetical protein
MFIETTFDENCQMGIPGTAGSDVRQRFLAAIGHQTCARNHFLLFLEARRARPSCTGSGPVQFTPASTGSSPQNTLCTHSTMTGSAYCSFFKSDILALVFIFQRALVIY